MAENNKYHIYQKANGIKLRDLLPLIRGATYSNYDELGEVVLCPECEEWTWVEMNISNCLFEQFCVLPERIHIIRQSFTDR